MFIAYTPTNFARKYLVISELAGTSAGKSFMFDREKIENNVYIYVEKGIFVVEQFGKKIYVYEGDSVVLQLTYHHKYYFEKNCETKIHWFHFKGKSVDELLEGLHQEDLLPYVKRNCQTNFAKTVFDMLQLKSKLTESVLSETIYCILLSTLDIAINQTVHNSDEIIDLTKLDKFLSNNISHKITLDELANHFVLSKYYFCRYFKEMYNQTPFEYITKFKIKIAKNLLDTTNLNIIEIANYLNFSDQSHFNRTFKTIEKLTPREYRNRIE